jgi:tetratricopeptide (TPR) repeat protein
MPAHHPDLFTPDLKQRPWFLDLQSEVRSLFKPRGTVSSLSAARSEERSMVRLVEQAVDSDPHCAGVIAELAAECRSRAVARPDEASWRFLHGRLLMAAGNALEAREELERAALLDPRDPRITAHLALWYEAALLAATGMQVNVELPPAPGPDISASAIRFAAIDEPLRVEEMAERALQLFEQALRFRLPRRDLHFLRRHAANVRDNASNTDARTHRRQLLHAV